MKFAGKYSFEVWSWKLYKYYKIVQHNNRTFVMSMKHEIAKSRNEQDKETVLFGQEKLFVINKWSQNFPRSLTEIDCVYSSHTRVLRDCITKLSPGKQSKIRKQSSQTDIFYKWTWQTLHKKTTGIDCIELICAKGSMLAYHWWPARLA